MQEEKNEFMLNLGKRLKQLREYRNLTQSQLGALVNKDYQSISRIENGRVNTSAYMLLKFAQALNVSMNDVFTFEEASKFDTKDDQIGWLSDRIVHAIENELFAEEALKVAEEKIRYIKKHKHQ
ncbi:helix-turn-helix domain-containing protein [Membranihabitans maritimus]|uniref:helix-turn-helix domain-containing protein n=1 Tax=Membranihabitans maritimus TaxID=2904244 RepID=UPI001F3278FB|nr:helix-turn-helix transcriptional regulator [Membranihabitans maritimus]